MKDIIDNNQNITSNSKQIEILKKNFPNCFDKDGKFIVDKLTEIVSREVDITNESYSLNWLGKSYARLIANQEVSTMLKEDKVHNQKDENKNSNNLYIEGDNLEVLKHMVNTYSESIKMIYIDPPYNTGTDFIYQDDRKFTVEELSNLTNIDEQEAQRILDFTNSKSNSHSAWLTFMYPRLYVARELLKEDGVIFISIDDNEQAQLKLLCDEVFGEENFVNNIAVKSKVGGVSGSSEGKSLQKNHEITFVYSKNNIYHEFEYNPNLKIPLLSYINNMKMLNKSWKYTDVLVDIDEGVYIDSINNNTTGEIKVYKHNKYKIQNINKIAKDKYNDNLQKAYIDNYNKIFRDTNAQTSIRQLVLEHNKSIGEELISIKYIPIKGKNKGREVQIYFKGEKRNMFTFLESVTKKENKNIYKLDRLGDMWTEVNYNNLFNESKVTFSNGQKPLHLIKQFIDFNLDKNDLILDFFSGSGTTAHAVMDLNAQDNGNRKFIMVNIPEVIDEKKNKSAYDFCVDELKEDPVITSIGKERIRRASKKIKEDNLDKEYINDLDFGFKVYKTTEMINTNYFKYLDKLEAGLQVDLINEDLTTEDLDSLLLTWKVYDGIEFNYDLQAVKFDSYIGYSSIDKLYLMDKGFDNKQVRLLLEKLDNDHNFTIRKIIILATNFNSKQLMELDEAIKGYKNKKSIELELEKRY